MPGGVTQERSVCGFVPTVQISVIAVPPEPPNEITVGANAEPKFVPVIAMRSFPAVSNALNEKLGVQGVGAQDGAIVVIAGRR